MPKVTKHLSVSVQFTYKNKADKLVEKHHYINKGGVFQMTSLQLQGVAIRRGVSHHPNAWLS